MNMDDVKTLQDKVRESGAPVYRLELKKDPEDETRIIGTIEIHFESRSFIQWCKGLEGLEVKERGRCGKVYLGDVCNTAEGIEHTRHQGSTYKWNDDTQ